jgi:hypothetical protein
MTERPDGITRRTALGLGLAAGTTAAIAGTNALRNEFVSAAPLAPQALAAPIAGARYLGIDAYAFFPDKAADRVYQDLTGSQPVTPGRRIWAPLPLPAGSIIVQLSASYQGQPIMEISRRPLFSGTAATAPAQVFQQSMNPSPGGPFASSVVVPNLEIDREATYTISAYCSAGTSVIGASVGYLEGFTPFRGTVPRILDTRVGPRWAAGSDHVVDTGLPGRIAVFNLTATDWVAPGWLATYRAGTAYPGNSSINFAGAGAIANLVFCEMNSTGQIAIRVGPAATHAVIDLIGSIV